MTHDETVEREKAKAVGHLLDMWEQYPNDERSCLMDPLRDALNSLMRAYEGSAALSALPRADDALAGIGPRPHVLVCKGCPAYETEAWREPSGDGETYDNGQYAWCKAAGRRSMGAYHYDHNAAPDWCPARARLAAQAEADDGWRTIERAPSEPGSFVGDIFYGDPTLTTQGTHRWNGSEWERLPSDAELLTKMLAASRAKELPSEMDHEMQMVWRFAWHAQSVIRHKARFKPEQPVSCEAAAWKAVVALIKARGKAAAQAGER